MAIGEIENNTRAWQKRILLTVWLTYSSFYLCRLNMSVAIPSIMHEFGYTKTMLGAVTSALFFTYAVGQFINGQLGDKFDSRKFITLGILGSAILNLIFGFSTGITMMIVIWALNGWFQSMGWAPSVKTIANWFPTKIRGRTGGIMGSSYQLGNAYSWALAGFVTGLLGWRWAFWVPAIIFIFMGIHWYLRGRSAPQEVGLPSVENPAVSVQQAPVKDYHPGLMYTLRLVATSRAAWAAAFGLFFLNITRYGFLDWAPTYLFEVQKAHISIAAYKAMALPLAGSLGAISAGWLSDKAFNSKRTPVIVIMLVLLSVFAFLYPRIAPDDWLLSLLCLLAVGFTLYGPHVLMVGILPMDIGRGKATSSVAGFIDGFGYIGASITGVSSGWLIDHFGWHAAFNLWIFAAIAAALLFAITWIRSRAY